MGPGWFVSPVWAWEMTAAARSRGFYGARAALVGLVLICIAGVWQNAVPSPTVISHRGLADLGAKIVTAIMAVQLGLVLFTAPALMVASIAADRQRGLLPHLLVTDLTAAEIVWGKVLGRLTPLMFVLACNFPVLALIGLLGGVDPLFLACSYIVVIATMAFTGGLGLACSLWCGKTHEANLLCFTIIALWFLSLGVGEWLHVKLIWYSPIWIFSGAVRRSQTAWWSVVYGSSLLGLALALILAVTWRLRPVCAEESGRLRSRIGLGSVGRLMRWMRLRIPGPDLDGNPVYWRECHRRRASPAGMLVTALFFLIAGGFSVLTVTTGSRSANENLAVIVNAFQCGFALLLLTVLAASVLAEERSRGSLDLIMATPLSAGEILWGKWLGIMRWSIPLAAFPALVFAGRIWGNLNIYALVLCLLGMALFFLYCSAIASCCLLLATRVTRQTRVTGIALATYVMITVGWPIGGKLFLGSLGDRLGMFSPVTAFGALTMESSRASSFCYADIRYSMVCLVVSAVLMGVTVAAMFVAWRALESRLGRAPLSGGGRRVNTGGSRITVTGRTVQVTGELS